MTDPSSAAYEAALGILCYLKHTLTLGITYDGNNPTFELWVDSSFGQCACPFGGHAVMYCGGVIAHQARKLTIVPQSSGEAETAVYSWGCKDMRFIMHVLSDLECKHLKLPIKVFTDSDAACGTISKPGATKRNRHYEAWVMYGRWQFLHNISEPVYMPTKKMVADIFTKCLDKTSFLKFRDILLNVSSPKH